MGTSSGYGPAMRAVVQRVTEASVTVAGKTVGRIGPGLCVLVGVTHDDDEPIARRMADKIWGLRIMDDSDGVMNRSVAETTGEVLVVSQFTLYGDTRKGRRPGWSAAARPEHAGALAPHFKNFLAGAKPPASTWVGVQSLAAPGLLIEIEAVAVVAG